MHVLWPRICLSVELLLAESAYSTANHLLVAAHLVLRSAVHQIVAHVVFWSKAWCTLNVLIGLLQIWTIIRGSLQPVHCLVEVINLVIDILSALHPRWCVGCEAIVIRSLFNDSVRWLLLLCLCPFQFELDLPLCIETSEIQIWALLFLVLKSWLNLRMMLLELGWIAALLAILWIHRGGSRCLICAGPILPCLNTGTIPSELTRCDTSTAYISPLNLSVQFDDLISSRIFRLASCFYLRLVGLLIGLGPNISLTHGQNRHLIELWLVIQIKAWNQLIVGTSIVIADGSPALWSLVLILSSINKTKILHFVSWGIPLFHLLMASNKSVGSFVQFWLLENWSLDVESLLWSRVHDASLVLHRSTSTWSTCISEWQMQVLCIMRWVSLVCLHWESLWRTLNWLDVDDIYSFVAWPCIIDLDLVLLLQELLVFYLLTDLVLNVV